MKTDVMPYAVSAWAAYSSYDLTDTRDGASQHLAEILAVQGPALSAVMVAMKRKGGRPRTSLGHALQTAARRMGTWPWRWRDPRRGLLLGMHSLLLAPFFASGLYVPLDCWSAREAGLAARSRGLRRLLRRTYAYAVAACEHLLLGRVSRILVVSLPEKAAYVARYPHLADRIEILPLRMPQVADPADPPPPAPDCAVLVWMDGRVGYGRTSILACLGALEPWPDLSVTILSRCEDLGVPLRHNQHNLTFVEDLDGLLRRQALVILPDCFGSGIKNRALEIGVRGVPLLATPTALEGLGWNPTERFTLVYEDEAGLRRAMQEFLARGSLDRAQLLRHKLASEGTSSVVRLLGFLDNL